MTTENGIVADDVVEVMIGLSSWLRAHKAMRMNILAVIVVAVEVIIYPSSLLKIQKKNPQ